MITLYGIPNCSTVKKARQWLSDNGLDYHFHDFKKQGVDAASLEQWASAVGLAKLINRQGTTWRALPDEVKAGAEQLPAALALMQANLGDQAPGAGRRRQRSASALSKPTGRSVC